MERASQIHPIADFSENTVENVENGEGNGNKLNTPPTSSAETFSPASSSKRGRLRAASLVGSPSDARGIGNPSVGFGAGLQNVPSPIMTVMGPLQAHLMESNNADHIREPLPVTQLPGITETLKDFAPNQANQPLITIPERPALVENDVPMGFSSDLGLSNADSQESKPSNGDPAGILNIYTRRADQIGPSHYIRGIGHLQDILPPPGWKQGDDPINEAEAKRLFVESRARAKDMLDQSTSETSHFSSADQERLTEENRKYQSQRALDEFLLLERVKLYHFWRDRKQKQSQQTRSQPQQNPQFELTPTTRPQPIQPPAETSMITYQRHQQSLVPASPHLYAPSPPPSGGTLNARINYMMQGLHIPQTSPMSPTFLDPGLVPQTLEAVTTCYARNQVLIMNMNNENERFLTQWSAKFNVTRPQDPVAPGVMPSITGQRAAPFGSVHYGYIPQEPRPWTPSQARFGGVSDSAAQTQQVRQIPPVSNRSDLRQGHGKAPSHPANPIGPFRHPGGGIGSPQRKTQAAVTPDSKKRGRTPKTNKNKTWYADEIAEANLPTSVISQAAMKAGMDFTTNEERKQTPSKPKGRRGMPVIDAKKGFAVSADAAKALIAKGAADARPVQQTGVLETSTTKSVAIIAPSTGVVADYQAAFYPSAGTQATSAPTLQGDEDTISAPNSAVSGPSSDTPDDPKDTNYNQRARRKPSTTHTPTAPGKVASTAAKKRKSTEAAGPAKKRNRPKVDGAADDE